MSGFASSNVSNCNSNRNSNSSGSRSNITDISSRDPSTSQASPESQVSSSTSSSSPHTPTGSSGDGKEGPITVPNLNDVLCGRGSGPNDHVGNVNFRRLVSTRRREYLATSTRTEKARIAREIVEVVWRLEPPGRFLERVTEGSWRVTSEEKSLEKVKQALRQMRHRRTESDSTVSSTANAAAHAGFGHIDPHSQHRRVRSAPSVASGSLDGPPPPPPPLPQGGYPYGAPGYQQHPSPYPSPYYPSHGTHTTPPLAHAPSPGYPFPHPPTPITTDHHGLGHVHGGHSPHPLAHPLAPHPVSQYSYVQPHHHHQHQYLSHHNNPYNHYGHTAPSPAPPPPTHGHNELGSAAHSLMSNDSPPSLMMEKSPGPIITLQTDNKSSSKSLNKKSSSKSGSSKDNHHQNHRSSKKKSKSSKQDIFATSGMAGRMYQSSKTLKHQQKNKTPESPASSKRKENSTTSSSSWTIMREVNGGGVSSTVDHSLKSTVDHSLKSSSAHGRDMLTFTVNSLTVTTENSLKSRNTGTSHTTGDLLSRDNSSAADLVMSTASSSVATKKYQKAYFDDFISFSDMSIEGHSSHGGLGNTTIAGTNSLFSDIQSYDRNGHRERSQGSLDDISVQACMNLVDVLDRGGHRKHSSSVDKESLTTVTNLTSELPKFPEPVGYADGDPTAFPDPDDDDDDDDPAANSHFSSMGGTTDHDHMPISIYSTGGESCSGASNSDFTMSNSNCTLQHY